jgi:hypothetical protein
MLFLVEQLTLHEVCGLKLYNGRMMDSLVANVGFHFLKQGKGTQGK